QGSLKTGITQDIYQQVPEYRQTIDKASEILQLDIGKLMFDEQKATQLLQTQYSQPVILSISLGLYQILKPALSGHKLVGMGLSLGEYSALACSGYLDFSSALKVIKRRGELMQQASEQIDSKMVAILKADLTAVQQACQKAQKKGIVSIANVNTPDKIVIG
ncbi:ACP S-malonyltransferase, partial [Lactobacillus sp. XV13L]|nr:ACP S-malonyltransferase [Lactobacillus sp. XV13L]